MENGNFRLGDWLVEPAQDRISHGEEFVSLQPQLMDLLVYFVRHRERVVSIDELLSHIWRDRVVTKASIYSGLQQLRVAIGDDAQNPRYIRTIPKRGYHLIADVEFEEAQQANSNLLSDVTRLKFDRKVWFAMVVSLAAVIVFSLFIWRSQPSLNPAANGIAPGERSMALPSSNTTGDTKHVGDSVVHPGPSANGHYSRALQQIEINSKNSLASALLDLQKALAQESDFVDAHVAIARVYLKLSHFDGFYKEGTAFEESRRLAEPHIQRALAINPNHAEAWLRKSELSVTDDPARIEALERALALDPNHYEAHRATGLAKLSFLLPWEEVIGHIDRAVEIDPLSIDAATTLVMFLAWVPHRWQEAENIIANLEQREPESIDVKMMKAEWLLYPAGRPSEAIPVLEEVLVIDPDHYWARSFLTKAWYMVGELERAYQMPGGIVHWRYVLSPDREESLTKLKNTAKFPAAVDYGRRIISSYAYVMLRDWQSAVDLLAGESGDLKKFTSTYVENFVLNESPAMSLAVAYKALGDLDNFNKFAELEQKAVDIRSDHGLLHNIEYSRAMARLDVLRGNEYKAMLELERLISEGPIDPRELIHPAFDGIRQDPHFARLKKIQLERVNRERVNLGLLPLESDYPPIVAAVADN